ncbi:hypothetical protein BDP27DRAFT_718801 [Rhodocollybia butyracea]|uniref:Uncharacterized protein n=1 Tax=Rhodocollybia butyracea TaxID=206335 RepID=A0A9P5PVW1_9AGAR|nr:hypothetical protein BDP27DRAFT_718801 [Rhodocollybia butyracea]
MRILNVVLAITVPVSRFTVLIYNTEVLLVLQLPLIFLGTLFIWCSTTVTVSRLTLRLRWVHVHKKLMDESEIIASCRWGLHSSLPAS